LKQPSKKFPILHFTYIDYMIFGQNQNMSGSLWVHVPNGNAMVVVMKYLGWDLAGYDFAEYAVRCAPAFIASWHSRKPLKGEP
jgi:hypothetical protein